MILSDRDLKARLHDGSIVIDPILEPALQIQPASIDLRLDKRFVVYNLAHVPCIDPRDSETVQKYTRTIEVEEGEPEPELGYNELAEGEEDTAGRMLYIRRPWHGDRVHVIAAPRFGQEAVRIRSELTSEIARARAA